MCEDKKGKKNVGKTMMEVVRPKQDVGGVRGSHPTEQQWSSMQGS
jgi:hypothetical protein